MKFLNFGTLNIIFVMGRIVLESILYDHFEPSYESSKFLILKKKVETFLRFQKESRDSATCQPGG